MAELSGGGDALQGVDQVSTSCIEPGEACRCRLETTVSVAATYRRREEHSARLRPRCLISDRVSVSPGRSLTRSLASAKGLDATVLSFGRVADISERLGSSSGHVRMTRRAEQR